MRVSRMMAPPSVTIVQAGSGQEVDIPMNVSPTTAPPASGGTVNDDLQHAAKEEDYKPDPSKDEESNEQNYEYKNDGDERQENLK